MRCRQIKQKLNDPDFDLSAFATNDQLADHINICPNCSQLLQAEKQMRHELQAAGASDTDEIPSLWHLRNQVESKATAHLRENNSMALFTNMIKKRSRLSISITAVVAILLLSFLIPFSYNKTIGYEVAFAGVDRNLALEEGRIQALLAKLGITDAEVNVSGCEQTCNVKIKSLKTTDDAQLVVAAFNKIENAVSLQEIREEIELETGNIYNKFVVDLKSHDNTKHNIAFFTDKGHLEKVHNVLIEKLGDDPEHEIYFTLHESQDLNEIELPEYGENTFFSEEGTLKFDIMKNESVDGSHQIVLHRGTPDELIVEIGPNGQIDKATLQLLHEHGIDTKRLNQNDSENSDHIVYKLERISDGKDESEAHAKESTLPDGFILNQNYPNPFNPTTTISFVLPQSSQVSLEIININGQKVKTIVDRTLSAGEHSYEWNATNQSGQKVASGVYLYKLSTPEFNSVKKLTLMK
ncbi:MAG: T9SS C-terminal target domain-containing protein [Calditrichaeota bacterium]|nr:MAG: T9SS C-terminal target domain-containing protein [Calditrichota bacterium]